MKYVLIKKDGKYTQVPADEVNKLTAEQAADREEVRKNKRFYKRAKFHFNDNPYDNSYRWK